MVPIPSPGDRCADEGAAVSALERLVSFISRASAQLRAAASGPLSVSLADTSLVSGPRPPFIGLGKVIVSQFIVGYRYAWQGFALRWGRSVHPSHAV